HRHRRGRKIAGGRLHPDHGQSALAARTSPDKAGHEDLAFAHGIDISSPSLPACPGQGRTRPDSRFCYSRTARSNTAEDRPMPRLTAISIENARPRAQRYAIADSGCRGLYLNVYPSGRKSWSVRYRFDGATRNLTLDGFLPLTQARMAATKALADVAQDKDP